MWTNRSVLFMLCVGLLTSTIGCGGSASGGPATDAVSGTVKFKGSPLGGATVTFHPLSKEGRTAVARTSDAGTFQLSTVKDKDGALPGEYRVTVSKTTDDQAAATQPAATFDMAAPAKPVKYKSVIPAKYGNPDLSGLTATVKKGGPNKVELTLTE